MITVWKYLLTITERQLLSMPRGTKVISVTPDKTGHDALLWALVDTEAPCEDRTVLIYQAGTPIGDHGEFIGTVQTHGRLYWHVFWETVETVEAVEAGSIWLITTGRSDWDTEGIADVRMTVNTTLGWYPTKQDAEARIATLEGHQRGLRGGVRDSRDRSVVVRGVPHAGRCARGVGGAVARVGGAVAVARSRSRSRTLAVRVGLTVSVCRCRFIVVEGEGGQR